ncbi:MAG: hypothetical protein ACI857_003285 [Arenicella sp.]
MAVDKFFRQIERRTEQDLYRKSMRYTYKSQQSLLNDSQSKFKFLKKKKVAKEVFWFFLSLLLGFLIGYLIYLLLGSMFPAFHLDLIELLWGDEINLIYLLATISFLGIYLIRVIFWSLNLLSKE